MNLTCLANAYSRAKGICAVVRLIGRAIIHWPRRPSMLRLISGIGNNYWSQLGHI